MATLSYDLARDYSSGAIQGWMETRQPGIAKQQFNLLRHAFSDFGIKGQSQITTGKKMFLFWITQQAFPGLKSCIPNYLEQRIGDCVSFSGKYTTGLTSIVEIFMKGEREKWRDIFSCYYYGTSRCWSGNWEGSYEDGSLGSWLADCVLRFGALFADEEGVPQYSSDVAKEWGANKGKVLEKWKSKAINYPVKTVAQIKNWDELCAAINNGYAVSTSSGVGYDMGASSDGFHRQTTSWSHAMTIVGTDETYKNGDEPYALILNSWGLDAHGILKDFETGDELPGGMLRVRRNDIEKHIRAGETYAFSNFSGFPEQKLDKSLFKLI